jgi:hypothetical protein
MGARRVVASMVGAAGSRRVVVDGLEMRAAPDDRGQTVKKKKNHMVPNSLSQSSELHNNPHP